MFETALLQRGVDPFEYGNDTSTDSRERQAQPLFRAEHWLFPCLSELKLSVQLLDLGLDPKEGGAALVCFLYGACSRDAPRACSVICLYIQTETAVRLVVWATQVQRNSVRRLAILQG